MQETGGISSMLETLYVLLELGGNVSRVNVVGNDLVAIAGNVNRSDSQTIVYHTSQLSLWQSKLAPRLMKATMLSALTGL